MLVVTPTATANTTYTVVGENNFGCKHTRTQAIFVNPLPTFNTSAVVPGNGTLVCIQGAGPSTATLSASPINCAGCTYSWSSQPNPTNMVVVSPLVHPTVYSVTATNNPNGCQSTLTRTLGIFQPTMDVLGTYSACLGGVTSLTATVVPFPTVLQPSPWLFVGGTSNLPFQIVGLSPTVQTSYVASVKTQSLGLTCTATKDFTITIYQNPTVTAVSEPSLICRNYSSAITGSGASTYQWSENNQIANTITVSPIVPVTTYTVVGIDANGCSGTTTVVVKTSFCPGITEISSGSNSLLNVYPNPNNGDFIVKGEETVTVSLVNQLGQEIRKIYLNDANNYQTNITNLANGVYFIVTDKGSQKVIVHK